MTKNGDSIAFIVEGYVLVMISMALTVQYMRTR